MRIFLIGFMGSDKSYTGKKLAKLLNYPFIDLDDWIEEQAQKSIRTIFEEEGEKAFRQKEKAALHNMERFTKTVIATGGGAPCFFDNIDWMNKHGLTIYLNTPTSILVQRLQGEKEHRPLVRQVQDLKAFIEKKIQERDKYYQQASIIYDQTSLNEDVADKLFKNLDNIIGH